MADAHSAENRGKWRPERDGLQGSSISVKSCSRTGGLAPVTPSSVPSLQLAVGARGSWVAVSELNPNVWQGHYGEGFVYAVAAAAGLDITIGRLGHRVDYGIHRTGPKGTSTSKQINIQVKSWAEGTVSEDDHFHYPLGVPAFNYLAGTEHDVRHFLVLCIVPEDESTYLTAEHEKTTMLRAAYWLSLRDEQPDFSLNEDSTKTVLVPRTHLLTPQTLTALVDGDEDAAVVT